MTLRNRWFTLVAVLFALLCVAPLAQAQNLEVHAHIPFAFTVGDTSLPAGDYVLTQVEPDNPAAYALTDRAKKVEVVFETSDSGREQADEMAGLSSPQLQFDTADGKAFLTRLELPSESLSRDVLTGTRYREMAPSVDWQPRSVTCVAAG